MTYSKIHWRETASGLWVRDFGPMEKFLHFVTVASPLRKQWIVQSGAILPSANKPTIQATKNAWLTLRYMHPIIGCTITDTGFEYRVQSQTQLAEWVDETVKIDQSGKSGQDISGAVNTPNTSELYFLPDRNEVFIQTRHELIDGTGCMMLLNNLLKALRQGHSPEFSIEDQVARLTPAVNQLVHAEDTAPEILESAQKYMETYSCSGQIGLKLHPSDPDASSESHRYVHEFSEKDTAAILKACKERGLTITHAATAASSQATLEQSEQDSGYLRSPLCINVREFLPEAYKGPEHAASVFFTAGLPEIPVSKSGDTLKLAHEIKQFYNKVKYDRDNVALSGPLLVGLEDAVRTAAANGIAPNFTVVSSWGIVDKYITEPFDDFWGNVTTLTTVSTVLFWLLLVVKVNSFLSWGAENNWVKDTYDWKKEVVLITGASSGYGERMTEMLAQRGIKVVTMSRRPLKPEIATHQNVHWYQCDVTDCDRVSQVAKQIRSDHGDPTVLVNNAGIISKGLIVERDISEVRKLIDVNLISQWKMLQEFLPAMARNNHGHVVSIASLASFVNLSGLGEYTTSKHGLLALHETLRQELRHIHKAPKVRTSIINPGWTTTPMLASWEKSLQRKGTPLLTTDEVVTKIVDVILSGYSQGPVLIPGFASFVTGLRGFPIWLQKIALDYFEAME
ncbi:Dehydrogenase RED2 [Drechslerella dactyloides]|uniref:Short-chain dehydrogenase/reductase 3 n=1 Tax=Drechslerella dactyloides TaxID=74499 RepID=A0AAD6J2P9_DREDA|nr:Dehydrogenase RED2 [Drechslerella dactyloides]